MSGTAEDSGVKNKAENEEFDSAANKTAKLEDHTKVVANHYNSIEEKGLDGRLESPIFYMRNFNNWIKGMVISEFLDKIKQETSYKYASSVLDMCCGKGGDLFKFKVGNIGKLVCTDIASVSVANCEDRYKLMKSRGGNRLFTADFIVADCTNARLKDLYVDPSIQFDLVNCQFAFHYCFESLPQAECMLRNASESLRPGGYFIGTMPDAADIMRRVQKNDGTSTGNDIFKIELQFDPTKGCPLFGAKYNFHLEGVVDCPEFLVHFPTLIDLAKKFDLHLVYKERFEDYFEKKREEGKNLLQKMTCFETYPLTTGNTVNPADYEHAKEFYEKNKEEKQRNIGTISKPQWEAACEFFSAHFS